MVTVGVSPPVAVTLAPRAAELAVVWVTVSVLTVGGSGRVSNDPAGTVHESPELFVARAEN